MEIIVRRIADGQQEKNRLKTKATTKIFSFLLRCVWYVKTKRGHDKQNTGLSTRQKQYRNLKRTMTKQKDSKKIQTDTTGHSATS